MLANPDNVRSQKSFTWHLPATLMVALTLRLMYLVWAQGNGLSNQSDGIEAYEVAVNFEAGDERAQYLGQPNCNPHSKLPGPLWAMFCAAGIQLGGGSALGIVLLIVLANIAAIALTWRLTRDLCGNRAADLAALFMAVSPWAVHFSSIVWNPSLLPLFGAVIFVSLFRCLSKNNSPAIFLVAFLILIGPQFHMSTLSLVIPLVVVGWLTRLNPNWRWLLVGAVAALLCYIPYIRGEMRHDWTNTRGIFSVGHGGFSPGALKVFSSPFSFLLNYWNPHWSYGPGDYQVLARRTFGGIIGLGAVNIVSVAFAVLVVLGALRATVSVMKNFRIAPREILLHSRSFVPAAFLLLAYLAVNLYAGRGFHARYCLLVLPLIFALAGFGAVYCLESPRLRFFFRPVLLLTVAANLWFVPAMCRFERDRIAFGPIFVPGYAKLESIYRQLKSRAPGRIEVRDETYLASLGTLEANRIYMNADMIRPYVQARELGLAAAKKISGPVSAFELSAANVVRPSDPAVAFYGNGVALVAVP